VVGALAPPTSTVRGGRENLYHLLRRGGESEFEKLDQRFGRSGGDLFTKTGARKMVWEAVNKVEHIWKKGKKGGNKRTKRNL